MPTLVDHFFVFLLVAVQPIWGALSWRKTAARMRAGEVIDRHELYNETLVLEWSAVGVLLAIWWWLSRPFGWLGMNSSSGWGFAAGCVMLGVAVAALSYGIRIARRADNDERVRVRTTLGELTKFIPDSAATFRHYVLVSVTAGICEEIIYRGFLFWYLDAFLPLWAVVLVSSVIFGLAHSYQGARGMARVTLIGIVFGGFYWLTGSIWLPILAHALLDILQGTMLMNYLRPQSGGRAAATA